MLWGHRWQRFALWVERSPLWFQSIVLPVVTPILMAVAAFCLVPRTTSVSLAVFIAAYGVLIRNGLQDWTGIGQGLGFFYMLMMLSTFVGVGENVSKRLYSKWLDRSRMP